MSFFFYTIVYLSLTFCHFLVSLSVCLCLSYFVSVLSLFQLLYNDSLSLSLSLSVSLSLSLSISLSLSLSLNLCLTLSYFLFPVKSVFLFISSLNLCLTACLYLSLFLISRPISSLCLPSGSLSLSVLISSFLCFSSCLPVCTPASHSISPTDLCTYFLTISPPPPLSLSLSLSLQSLCFSLFSPFFHFPVSILVLWIYPYPFNVLPVSVSVSIRRLSQFLYPVCVSPPPPPPPPHPPTPLPSSPFPRSSPCLSRFLSDTLSFPLPDSYTVHHRSIAV